MFKLYKKLRYIKQRLKEWSKEIFGNINQEFFFIEDRMRNLYEICIDRHYTEDQKKEEIQLTQEWEEIFQQEETLWCQKKEGEQNTRFFH
jgi:hypothetical protein